MKLYFNNDGELVIGTAREIKSLWKNLVKKTNFCPVFCEEPKFNMDKMYGIYINDTNYGEFTNGMVVVNSDTCLEIIAQ